MMGEEERISLLSFLFFFLPFSVCLLSPGREGGTGGGGRAPKHRQTFGMGLAVGRGGQGEWEETKTHTVTHKYIVPQQSFLFLSYSVFFFLFFSSKGSTTSRGC